MDLGTEDGAGNKKAKIIFLGNAYFCGEIVNKQIYSGVKNKWDNDTYKENTWQGKWRHLNDQSWGCGRLRAASWKVDIWDGYFLGKKNLAETSECNVLRQEYAWIAFLNSWKHIFFFTLFVQATVLDIPCSLYPYASEARPHPPKLSDLILVLESPDDISLARRATIIYFLPCSGSALLILGMWSSRPHLNISQDHCISRLLTWTSGLCMASIISVRPFPYWWIPQFSHAHSFQAKVLNMLSCCLIVIISHKFKLQTKLPL